MVWFKIALIVDREGAGESTGQHDFGRLVRDVSPLYRIKKRKRRQTHLPPPSPHRETSNPLYDSGDPTGKTLRGEICETLEKIFRRLLPALPSLVPTSPLCFSALSAAPLHSFASTCSALLYDLSAPSSSSGVARPRDRSEFHCHSRITCRALSSVFLWIFSSKTDLIICPFSASGRYLVPRNLRLSTRVNLENFGTRLIISRIYSRLIARGIFRMA